MHQSFDGPESSTQDQTGGMHYQNSAVKNGEVNYYYDDTDGGNGGAGNRNVNTYTNVASYTEKSNFHFKK